MRKKLIRAILFPAILCLLLVPASLLVLPKNNTAEAGTLHPDADGILSQRRDSIDVLFLGDSLAYCGTCCQCSRQQRPCGSCSQRSGQCPRRQQQRILCSCSQRSLLCPCG